MPFTQSRVRLASGPPQFSWLSSIDKGWMDETKRTEFVLKWTLEMKKIGIPVPYISRAQIVFMNLGGPKCGGGGVGVCG